MEILHPHNKLRVNRESSDYIYLAFQEHEQLNKWHLALSSSCCKVNNQVGVVFGALLCGVCVYICVCVPVYVCVCVRVCVCVCVCVQIT